MDGMEIKRILLEVINEYSAKGPGFFQTKATLKEAAKRLKIGTKNDEQALLTIWNDLFRQGILGWGHDINNSEPPFIHITDIGRKFLQNVSHDPYNPDGYIAAIKKKLSEESIAFSYIAEGIQTFQAGCFKATAVMTGAAAESLILELRDEIINKMNTNGITIPKNLNDWRVKTVRDEITIFFDSRKKDMGTKLSEKYSAFWIPISEQMRITRNDAGHPKQLDPVSHESVYASLLLFPEFVSIVLELKIWVQTSF